jgi:hypothetical protein
MPTSIKITGIAPPGLSGLPQPMRQQFWQIVAPIALKVKDNELAAGLDAHGDPLRPISPRTRKYRRSAMTPSGKGDPSAPPLMPARQKSRTRALLAARALPTHVELYWRFDPFTGDQWARILTFQRQHGRDVFGVSPDGMRQIRDKAWAEWEAWKKRGAAPEEYKRAYSSAALTAGPQSRIAQIIAGSAQPNAGSKPVPQVGGMNTRWITRGIQAPTVKELKQGSRTGGLTGQDWRRYYTEEVGGQQAAGRIAAMPPKPRPIKPRIVTAKPPQKIAQKPVQNPPPVVNLTLDRFATLALTAARAVPAGQRYSSSKVFVIDAYNELLKSHPEISLAEFKRRLVEAHQARKLTLGRADAPGWGGAEVVARDQLSEIDYFGMTTFQVIIV